MRAATNLFLKGQNFVSQQGSRPAVLIGDGESCSHLSSSTSKRPITGTWLEQGRSYSKLRMDSFTAIGLLCVPRRFQDQTAPMACSYALIAASRFFGRINSTEPQLEKRHM